MEDKAPSLEMCKRWTAFANRESITSSSHAIAELYHYILYLEGRIRALEETPAIALEPGYIVHYTADVDDPEATDTIPYIPTWPEPSRTDASDLE